MLEFILQVVNFTRHDNLESKCKNLIVKSKDVVKRLGMEKQELEEKIQNLTSIHNQLSTKPEGAQKRTNNISTPNENARMERKSLEWRLLSDSPLVPLMTSSALIMRYQEQR